MDTNKALKILSAHRQALVDEYGIKKIGVYPYANNGAATHDSESGRCCTYNPQIGVAVEYRPEVKVGLLEFAGLKLDIEDLFGCDISLSKIGGRKDPRFKRDESYLEAVVYAG